MSQRILEKIMNMMKIGKHLAAAAYPSRPGLTLAAIHLSTLKHPQAATSFDKSKWSIQTIAAQRKYRKKVFTSALKAFSVFF